jgi:hypothetical protein
MVQLHLRPPVSHPGGSTKGGVFASVVDIVEIDEPGPFFQTRSRGEELTS